MQITLWFWCENDTEFGAGDLKKKDVLQFNVHDSFD